MRISDWSSDVCSSDLQRPAALVIELADLAHVRQGEGEQPVYRDGAGADPRVEAEQQHQRRQHLADQRAVGEESWQAVGDDHALDGAEPGLQLRDAVQQDQCAQRDARHQLAEILHCRLVHGRVPRWLVGRIMAGTGRVRPLPFVGAHWGTTGLPRNARSRPSALLRGACRAPEDGTSTYAGRCAQAWTIRAISHTPSVSAAGPGWRVRGDLISCSWPSRTRSEEHKSELQSLMRISYAVFCLKKKKQTSNT